ncbi:hypothetical protein SD70_29705 [Gordoniibacillus kamchatkensis]|uniref:HTH luxR-type domain-containing protein n=1 Tax=Gordoniibacillus kamchatkensis TaxID=1590651 RepID=A0ABR5AA75_9BACL|nr:hypothetical protein [Paenibacillus sp. VKM B-2647]KIL37961.1 hypothetical protein SD70_29705 [Paenibacillus sp. VKM B-2647]
MFDPRQYILDTVHNPRPASVEIWATRTEKLLNVEKHINRHLTVEEKKILTWLATGEPHVVEMLSSLFDEIAGQKRKTTAGRSC